MKETVFVNLMFGGSSVPVKASAKISIPFKVSKIHVKSLSFQSPAGYNDYVVLKSNLDAQNSPLGILYRNSTFSAATVNNVEIVFQNPQVIQGVYDFFTYEMTGALSPPTNPAQDDYISLVLEFNGPDEIF